MFVFFLTEENEDKVDESWSHSVDGNNEDDVVDLSRGGLSPGWPLKTVDHKNS